MAFNEYFLSMRPHIGFLLLGVLLVLAGLFLPRDWYDALPRNGEALPPPIKGITLLQVSLVIEGLILIGLAFKRWRFATIDQALLLPTPAESSTGDLIRQRTAVLVLAAITLGALSLRLVNLDSDLWLDEISTIVVYGPMSLVEVIGGYINFNNHLLNTLLVKLSMALFGENEWAVRLPVALFGTATIPVIYWIARLLGLPRGVSLGVALLLAVSYHHIFFSQNARGYVPHVFFSLIASGLLVKALQTDRLRLWVLYVAVMFLNFASLLTSAYVLAAHGLVGLTALLALRRRGVSPTPLLRRLTVVFGLTGFLAFQLYALILPHAYLRAQAKYDSDGGYFALFSIDLLVELVRGITAGLGVGTSPYTMLILAAGAAVAGTGLVALLRRSWALTLALSLPGVLGVLFILLNGLTFSPRFFLLALPVGMLAAVQGVYTLGELAGRKLNGNLRVLAPRLATAALVLLALAVSLASLKSYYSMPKQAYSASIEYLEDQRTNGEMVIVVDLAERGYRYYGHRLGVMESGSYFFVQSVEDLEVLLSTHAGRDSYLVTTLPRFLHLRKPDLEARIQQDWTVIRSFPGTIGNGQISVWAESQP